MLSCFLAVVELSWADETAVLVFVNLLILELSLIFSEVGVDDRFFTLFTSLICSN